MCLLSMWQSLYNFLTILFYEKRTNVLTQVISKTPGTVDLTRQKWKLLRVLEEMRFKPQSDTPWIQAS